MGQYSKEYSGRQEILLLEWLVRVSQEIPKIIQGSDRAHCFLPELKCMNLLLKTGHVENLFSKQNIHFFTIDLLFLKCRSPAREMAWHGIESAEYQDVWKVSWGPRSVTLCYTPAWLSVIKIIHQGIFTKYILCIFWFSYTSERKW